MYVVYITCVVFCLPYISVLWQVSEMAVSELPGNPNAVGTVKTTASGGVMIKLLHNCVSINVK